MPKMKTHRGLAKRVKVTGSGRLRRRSPNLNHILEKSHQSVSADLPARVT